MNVGNIVDLARSVIDALGLSLTTGFRRVEYELPMDSRGSRERYTK